MTRLTRSAIFLACFWLTFGGAVIAQGVDPELRKIAEARDAARTKRNFEVWSRYTVDQYVLTTETGELRTKADQIAQMKSSPAGDQGRYRDEKFLTYGNAVLQMRINDTAAGPRREMIVWIKDAGQWKVAAVQMTLIQKR